jgi:hypothetical protein
MPIQIAKYVGVASGQNASALAGLAPNLYLTNSVVADDLTAGQEIGRFYLSNRATDVFELVNTVDGAFAIENGNVLVVGPAGVPAFGGEYTLIITAGDYAFEVQLTVTSSLDALFLSNNTVAAAAPPGTVIGQISNTTPGSTLSILSTDPAGAFVALGPSNTLVTGSESFDPGTLEVFIQESHPAVSNSPRVTPLSVVFLPATPVNQALPVITGELVEGGVLTRTLGTWMNDPSAFATQWQADGADIVGATSATFTLSFAQADANITVRITATNTAGSTVAVSEPVRFNTVTYLGENVTYLGENVTYPVGGY